METLPLFFRPRAARISTSRASRATSYQLDQALFTLTGNVILANFRAARVLAQKLNNRVTSSLIPNRSCARGN